MALADLPNPKWDAAGKQVILKEDFKFIEDAILENGGVVSGTPPLVWVDADTVRVEATADCPADMLFNGMPNILNPAIKVSGGLSDNKVRGITSNVSMIISAGALWGSEKASQWYAVFSLAADVDTVFTLKSMPYLRVKSQTSQTIKTGTHLVPATGINYAFTNDEFISGRIYFLTGVSKGLMRNITANNVDTDTTITYDGDALSVAAGDWFIVLPPGTNFRWLGDVWNNSSSNFTQVDDVIFGREYLFMTAGSYVWTCPLTWTQGVLFTGCAGGAYGGSLTADGAGHGGGAGQAVMNYPLSPTPGDTYALTVGTYSVATVFGALLTLTAGAANGGNKGIYIVGQYAKGGQGASNIFGGGGVETYTTSGQFNGNAGTGYGSGGGGSVTIGAGSTTGGAGKAGFAKIVKG
jgi:hypothetical protein